MANQVLSVIIPPATDLDNLRQSLQFILNRLAQEIASTTLKGRLDANSNRIVGLADPSNGKDAVNFQTLQKEVARIKNSLSLSINGASGGGVIGGGTSVDGYYTITPIAGVATVNLSNGKNQQLILDGTVTDVALPVSSGTILAGDTFFLYVDEDVTGGHTFPTFATGAGGFASDVNSQDPILTASTRTAYQFTFHGSVWGLDSFRTNGSLS